MPAVFSTLEERYLPEHRSAVAQLLARSQECRVVVFSPGTCTQTSRLFRSQLLSAAEKELLAQRAVGDAELILHEHGRLGVRSRYRYIQGFGHHYVAVPEVTVTPDSGVFDISLSVTNLSSYQPMPLQYMCHMNHAFVSGGVMSDNLGEGAFQLRCTVPAHVIPTPEWEEINRKILAGEYDASSLEGAEAFDPEIVYFAEDLPTKAEQAEFKLTRPDGSAFVTSFSTDEFPVATHWILHNPDQSVSAFALPGTSRPEGFLAAKKAGTLIELEPGKTRSFTVTTGLKNADELKEAHS